MATVVNFTLPIYEAVVCNLTLEKMRQDETEQEHEALLAKTLESVTRAKEVLRVFSESDFSAIPAEVITQTHVALCVLVSIGRPLLAHMRQSLPNICVKYRDALVNAVDDLEGCVDGIEALCEAWGVAHDDDAVEEIKRALSDYSINKDVPDWREALAALPD